MPKAQNEKARVQKARKSAKEEPKNRKPPKEKPKKLTAPSLPEAPTGPTPYDDLGLPFGADYSQVNEAYGNKMLRLDCDPDDPESPSHMILANISDAKVILQDKGMRAALERGLKKSKGDLNIRAWHVLDTPESADDEYVQTAHTEQMKRWVAYDRYAHLVDTIIVPVMRQARAWMLTRNERAAAEAVKDAAEEAVKDAAEKAVKDAAAKASQDSLSPKTAETAKIATVPAAAAHWGGMRPPEDSN